MLLRKVFPHLDTQSLPVELSALGLSVGKSIYFWAKAGPATETEGKDDSVEKETQAISDPPLSSPISAVTAEAKSKSVSSPPVSFVSADHQTKFPSTELGKLKSDKSKLLQSKVKATGRGGLDVTKAAIVRSGVAELEFVDGEDDIEQ